MIISLKAIDKKILVRLLNHFEIWDTYWWCGTLREDNILSINCCYCINPKIWHGCGGGMQTNGGGRVRNNVASFFFYHCKFYWNSIQYHLPLSIHNLNMETYRAGGRIRNILHNSNKKQNLQACNLHFGSTDTLDSCCFMFVNTIYYHPECCCFYWNKCCWNDVRDVNLCISEKNFLIVSWISLPKQIWDACFFLFHQLNFCGWHKRNTCWS